MHCLSYLLPMDQKLTTRMVPWKWPFRILGAVGNTAFKLFLATLAAAPAANGVACDVPLIMTRAPSRSRAGDSLYRQQATAAQQPSATQPPSRSWPEDLTCPRAAFTPAALTALARALTLMQVSKRL